MGNEPTWGRNGKTLLYMQMQMETATQELLPYNVLDPQPQLDTELHLMERIVMTPTPEFL